MGKKTGSSSKRPRYAQGNSRLEFLEAKIKLRIICELRNEETLSNLISAYPAFRRVKCDNEKQITTSMAIHHLTDLGCNPFHRHDIVEFTLPHGAKVHQDDEREHETSNSPQRNMQADARGGTYFRLDHRRHVDKPTDPSIRVLPIKYHLKSGDRNIRYDDYDRPIKVGKNLIGKLDYRHHDSGVSLLYMTKLVRENKNVQAAATEKMLQAAAEDKRRVTAHRERSSKRERGRAA